MLRAELVELQRDGCHESGEILVRPGELDQGVDRAAEHQVQTGVLSAAEVGSHGHDWLEARVGVAALPGRPGVGVRPVQHRHERIAAVDSVATEVEGAVKVRRVPQQRCLRVVLGKEHAVTGSDQQLGQLAHPAPLGLGEEGTGQVEVHLRGSPCAGRRPRRGRSR